MALLRYQQQFVVGCPAHLGGGNAPAAAPAPAAGQNQPAQPARRRRTAHCGNTIERNENLIAHSWHVVLIISFVIACGSLLYWDFMAGSAWGPGRHTASVTRRHLPITVPQPPVIRPAATQLALPVPVPPPTAVVAPTERGPGLVADTVHQQPTPPPPAVTDEHSGFSEQAPSTNPNPCANLTPAEEQACRVWSRQ